MATNTTGYNNVVGLLKHFPDEGACARHLEAIRWPDGIICQVCGSSRKIHRRKKAGVYRCADCKKEFSVRKGTIYEESPIPLQKWFLATFLMVTSRKGISSCQLAREIGVTQKTAWFVLGRLRQAAAHASSAAGTLPGPVEADESYLGGKNKNRHASQKQSGRGPVGKMAVPNWQNQTVWTGDNLDIMRGMNSASVDLIYLDPPFNSKANYAAPIGSKAAGAAFKDTWTLRDVDVEWINLIEAKHPALYRVLLAAMTPSDKSYLAYMAVRLLEMNRLLKPTGSIYLHCDPTMSHYLKLVMDALFGRKAFRNEIVWQYSTFHGSKRNFKRNYDQVLFYVKTGGFVFDWEAIADPYHPKTIARFDKQDEQGRYKFVKGKKCYMGKGVPPNACFFLPQLQMNASEHVGYPTQKPLALLQRMIKASCPPDGVVLDPFCGCATTCVAAEMEGRQWAGIDISPKAADLVVSRMQDELGLFYRGAHRADIPQRTDLGKVLPYNDAKNKRTLYGEQGGSCNGCQEHFRPQNLEIDHIIPRAKGGTDHLDNLQLLCGYCNRVKGDRGMEYLMTKLQLAA